MISVFYRVLYLGEGEIDIFRDEHLKVALISSLVVRINGGFRTRKTPKTPDSGRVWPENTADIVPMSGETERTKIYSEPLSKKHEK